MRSFRRIALQRLQRFCRGFGLDVVPTWHMERLPQARYLRRVFMEFGVTGVIDVGANEGQYHDFLRKEVEFTGPVISIEPIPALAALMRGRTASASNWVVEQKAMGATPGRLKFNVTAGSQFSSFLQPIAETEAMFGGQNIVSEAIEVEVDTLSAVIARHSTMLGPRVYLKLDTQGFDLEALKGLHDVARRVVALQTETSVKPIYATMPGYTETISFVEELGFTVSQIFPNNEGHFPRLIEFDCHFVRLSD